VNIVWLDSMKSLNFEIFGSQSPLELHLGAQVKMAAFPELAPRILHKLLLEHFF